MYPLQEFRYLYCMTTELICKLTIVIIKHFNELLVILFDFTFIIFWHLFF